MRPIEHTEAAQLESQSAEAAAAERAAKAAELADIELAAAEERANAVPHAVVKDGKVVSVLRHTDAQAAEETARLESEGYTLRKLEPHETADDVLDREVLHDGSMAPKPLTDTERLDLLSGRLDAERRSRRWLAAVVAAVIAALTANGTLREGWDALIPQQPPDEAPAEVGD